MSHPTFWPSKTFFYPIGNTPPICLTDHLPPEEDATILLLGCGDPRSILFTVTVDHNPSRVLDINCCDWQPAIIARNILLLTLIADSVDSTRLPLFWNIFYDLFLDKDAVSLLSEQCTKLANSAADMTTWNSSTYGSFIKFTTQETLDEARHHWSSYTETLHLPKAKQKELKQMYLSTMKAEIRSGADTTCASSAAPLILDFTTSRLQTYTHYWKTGVTSANSNTTSFQINPTFLFSLAGRRFHLHYGTDPCAAFHLALGMIKVTYGDGSTTKPGKTEHDMWNACRDQFSRWALAFHHRLQIRPAEKLKTIIRFGVGDALAYCDALQLWKTGDFTPAVYSSMWGSAKFAFHDQTMPTSFNVVDTSNLSDHLGLLNILVAVAPLLLRSPCTVLNTTSLLSYSLTDDPTRRSAIEERALMNFPSLSLLLGITPICFHSGLNFRNGSEIASFSSMATGNSRHPERVAWRYSQWGGSLSEGNLAVSFEPQDLADKLFTVYLKMFESENFGSLFGKLSAGDTNKTMVQNTHYHRRSFVRLLRAVRDLGFVKTIWPRTFDHFVARVTTNTQLLVGANNFQNLFAELHLEGIFTESILEPGFVAKTFGERSQPYKSWDSIPPLVCLVLKVRRSKLKALENPGEDAAGYCPLLECETFHPFGFQNIHDTIRPIFGDVVEQDGRVTIQEDPDGLNGKSPLVVSFFLPSWILTNQPNKIQVALSLKKTPMTSSHFMPKLGLGLQIYATSLLDHDNVFILHERPDNPGELERIVGVTSTDSTDSANASAIQFAKRDRGGEVLIKRLNIISSSAKDALANKANVIVKQTGPACLEVSIDGKHQHSLHFPVPIESSCLKTRIARKSSYVEVELPPRTSPLSHRLALQPFPMTSVSTVNQNRFVCWNTPYINLDALPSIDLSANSKWVGLHLGHSMSAQERHMQRTVSDPQAWGPFVNFKSSITHTIQHYAENQYKVYVVRDPSRQHPHLILFLLAVRLDLSSATTVGDAMVVFPDSTNFRLLIPILQGTNVITNIYDDELQWWNHALPALSERCRKWKHSASCEYIRNQCIPLSIEYEQTPLCSCGRGKNLEPFLKNRQWKALAPHAVRIALSPIFPVSYLESVVEQEMLDLLKNWSPFSPSPMRSFSPTPTSSRTIEGTDSSCRRCGGSGRPKLLRCSGCQRVKYCSKDCQAADWKYHKLACKEKGRLTS